MQGAKRLLPVLGAYPRPAVVRPFLHTVGNTHSLPDLYWNSTCDALFALRISADGQFILQAANPSFLRLSNLNGITPGGRRLGDCLPADLSRMLVARCEECLATGTAFHCEDLVVTPEGPRWCRLELTPVKNTESDVVGTIVGRLQDCAFSFRLPTAANQSERLLRQIVDTSPDVIYVFDWVAGRNVFLSSRVRRSLGYSSDFLQGLNLEGLLQLIHPEDLSTVREHMLRVPALADGAIATAEFRCLTGHAGYRWFRAKETIFSRTQDGSVEKVIGILSDIDCLKKARIAFTEANAQLRSILASISDCYLTVDDECRITGANAAAAKWLSRAPTGIIGQKLRSLAGNSEAHRLVAKAIRDKRTLHGEMPSRLHPGRWIDLRAYPSGRGVNVFFSDVTKRRRAEQAAARSAALLDASLDSLSVQIVIVDKNGTIVTCNKAWRCFAAGLRRRRREAAPGSNLLALYERAAGRLTEGRHIARGLRSILAGRSKAIRHIYHMDAGLGVRWHQLAAARFTHAGDAFAVVATEDVTEARHASRTMGELSERLLTLQEDERQRIAAELHSSTAQHLAAIGLNVLILKNRDGGRSGDEPLWSDVEFSLERATRELRAFMYMLHPVQLDSDGFSATLRRFVEGFAARTGLEATLKLGRENQLPAMLQRSLLRTVQEALVNAHVNTMATRVSICLTRGEGQMHLVVRDNGTCRREPDGRADQRRLGVGLPAMRQRLRRIGGNLEIELGRSGTRIDVSVPCVDRTAAPQHSPRKGHPASRIASRSARTNRDCARTRHGGGSDRQPSGAKVNSWSKVRGIDAGTSTGRVRVRENVER